MEGDDFAHSHQETRFIHAGQKPDPVSGAIITPISLSTTFAQRGPGGLYSTYEYSRSGNPTRTAFEHCLAAAEGGRFGLAFASGCAATLAIMSLYGPGDHIITSDDVYGGTRRIFSRFSGPKQQVETSFVNTSSLELIREAIRPNTKLLWIETLYSRSRILRKQAKSHMRMGFWLLLTIPSHRLTVSRHSRWELMWLCTQSRSILEDILMSSWALSSPKIQTSTTASNTCKTPWAVSPRHSTVTTL
jgi:hypothetical protein